LALQGRSVALSADGNTAIEGGYLDSQGPGAVWVFTRSNGVWTQQGSKLVATDAVGNAHVGYSVALSADGNTAIVGGRDGSTGQDWTGASWVYTRSNGVWTQQGGMWPISDNVQRGIGGADASPNKRPEDDASRRRRCRHRSSGT
jgi:hypothetical protein